MGNCLQRVDDENSDTICSIYTLKNEITNQITRGKSDTKVSIEYLFIVNFYNIFHRQRQITNTTIIQVIPLHKIKASKCVNSKMLT